MTDKGIGRKVVLPKIPAWHSVPRDGNPYTPPRTYVGPILLVVALGVFCLWAAAALGAFR